MPSSATGVILSLLNVIITNNILVCVIYQNSKTGALYYSTKCYFSKCCTVASSIVVNTVIAPSVIIVNTVL